MTMDSLTIMIIRVYVITIMKIRVCNNYYDNTYN